MIKIALRKSGFVATALFAASVAHAGLVTLTFDDAVRGRSYYAYDGDRDGTPDVVLSTSDASGFNTVGPGANMHYISEPGIEGTTALSPDLRVNFVRGAVNAVSFGYAVIAQGLGVTFSLFDAQDRLLASTDSLATFQSLSNGLTGSFPEAQVNLAFAGTAAYGTFDFRQMTADGPAPEFGRYIIDNLSTDFAGDGTLPSFGGIIPSDPVLPGATVTNPDGSIRFDFSLLPAPGGLGVTSPIFIDPLVAVGYDYRVTSGPRFAAVVVPSALPNGDQQFRLVVAGHADQVLMAGDEFDLLALDASGVDAFSILDIDTGEALDPLNATAFVTGLRFVGGGAASVSQTALTTFIADATSLPEPATPVLALSSLALMAGLRRQRARSRSLRPA